MLGERRNIAGYSPPGLEKVSQHVYDVSGLMEIRTKAPDVKESFESHREGDEAMPNIWLPEGVLPGFKEACLDSSGYFRINGCMMICHSAIIVEML